MQTSPGMGVVRFADITYDKGLTTQPCSVYHKRLCADNLRGRKYKTKVVVLI
ncbi:hypothetical protein CLDAP_01440 [Caldilinea aerophila DSM 14535 = NBRC 104270]|uniref:Uncharacterized protein n=1 Tax=Caldilinea aerophila (strain DSM 14535 / JCM 11387 / NBRC 104270 / STL-6-O1) TaxID=926550 RepID=I0HYU6_CALAS|nr:hypothetical protein CLDAP_01440 [Caldilinea aerophila DSM 14535 = NBRC 104270]